MLTFLTKYYIISDRNSIYILRNFRRLCGHLYKCFCIKDIAGDNVVNDDSEPCQRYVQEFRLMGSGLEELINSGRIKLNAILEPAVLGQCE